MDRRAPFFLALLLCSFPVTASALAQSNSPSTSPAAQPEQTTQAAAQATTVASDQPPAKKVWTNDDMSDVRDGSGIPNHPAAAKKPGAAVKPPASKGPATPKGKDAKWYQDQIAKLQAQLPPIEGQISDLQAALSGQSVDAVRKFGWLRPDDWNAQLVQLQQKRDGIFTKIGTLEDEARHNGVPMNILP